MMYYVKDFLCDVISRLPEGEIFENEVDVKAHAERKPARGTDTK